MLKEFYRDLKGTYSDLYGFMVIYSDFYGYVWDNDLDTPSSGETWRVEMWNSMELAEKWTV